MKRISVIHLILVVGTLILCSSKLNGMQSNVEMIPYRLVPSMDIECPIHIEIIHPISMLGVPLIYEDEFIEVIKERVVFETTNPFAQNEIFSIDGKQYYLLRVPYTGVSWK
jgi:hypothetical protein|tara:strand:- start:23 stop:355 length:333 start_codon:yes stop_codon:yes gene_type:complete